MSIKHEQDLWVPDIPTPFEEKQGDSFSAEGAKMSANGASFQGGLGAWPPPPGNFANLVSLKWHFQHVDIISVVFFKVLDSEKMD